MYVLIFNGVVSKGMVYCYKVQVLFNKKNYDILCFLSMDIIFCDKVVFFFFIYCYFFINVEFNIDIYDVNFVFICFNINKVFYVCINILYLRLFYDMRGD